VLYDYNIKFNNGDIVPGTKRTDPVPTPGTPRHPAYPSGHSTYSAAASTVLGCLMPDDFEPSFKRLANNIGRARLWAGVHWRQDHLAGQLIGQTVGQLVIRQLNESGILAKAIGNPNVPDEAALRAMERETYATWRTLKDFCTGIGFMPAGAKAAADDLDERMNPGPEFEGEDQLGIDTLGHDEDGELDIDAAFQPASR
jgi:hypothetical protein